MYNTIETQWDTSWELEAENDKIETLKFLLELEEDVEIDKWNLMQ